MQFKMPTYGPARYDHPLENSMLKIEGLDKLTRELRAAEEAMASINGELGSVQFDSKDAGSIERAIIEVETMIDEKLSSYAGNSLVSQMGDAIKENLREQIIERAAQSRAKGSEEA